MEVKGKGTTFQEYEQMVGQRLWESTERTGQVFFNTLYLVRPRLANTIRGTVYDPFYDDANIEKFYDYVKAQWNTWL